MRFSFLQDILYNIIIGIGIVNDRYVEDDEGIKKYFAAFHLHNTFPSTIIIDDFGDFFDERCLFLLLSICYFNN